MIRMDLLEENNQKAEDHFKPAVSGTFQIGVGTDVSINTGMWYCSWSATPAAGCVGIVSVNDCFSRKTLKA